MAFVHAGSMIPSAAYEMSKGNPTAFLISVNTGSIQPITQKQWLGLSHLKSPLIPTLLHPPPHIA